MFTILGFIFNVIIFALKIITFTIVACVAAFLIIVVWKLAKSLYNWGSQRRARDARSSTYSLHRQTNYEMPYSSGRSYSRGSSSGTSRDTSSLASDNVTFSTLGKSDITSSSAKDDSFDNSFLDDDPTLYETGRRDDDYSPGSYSGSASSKSSLSNSYGNDNCNDSDDCNSDDASDYDDDGDYDYGDDYDYDCDDGGCY